MSQTIESLRGRVSLPSLRILRQFVLEQDIEFVSCCLFRNAAPWSVPRRTCADSFLLFPVKGRVRVLLEKGSRELGPGEYLMLPENRGHALEIGNGGRHLHQISLHCQIHDRWNRPFLAQFRRPFGVLRDPKRWFESLKDLACLSEHDTPLAQAYGEALIRVLLAERVKEEKEFPPPPAGGDPRIERFLRLMEERLESPLLSIDALAREVNLSPARLRQLFRRDLGDGPKEHLTQLRLRKAVRMLRDSSKRVKQIARECGFSADHYFHLVFRKAFGCTPSEYRTTRAV